FWLLTVVLVCGSFIILLFARYQSLLSPWSKLRVSQNCRIVFYVYVHASLSLIPIGYLLVDTPLEVQKKMLQYFELDWIADGKVFGIFNGVQRYSQNIVFVVVLV
ncbi:hypothetical protein PFISCL1PPCAC_13034, partial [Pristionchus fissidentatus]